MAGGFFGLDIAVRGLFTAHRNLDIVNHNLSNVNTEGYSRQVAEQKATRPLSLFDGTGMIGTGSEVIAIKRMRDEYLDFKFWSEHDTYGQWEVKNMLFGEIQAIFNEPSDSGFSKVMDDFFSALQELSKDPSSETTRTLVRQKGVTLAKYFNSAAAHLEKIQSDINYNINLKVNEINSLAAQIQSLNKQIFNFELDGSSANDLRDQRTLLVDKLSKIINIDAREVVVGTTSEGRDITHFVVSINGKDLVNHFELCQLKVTQRQNKLNEEDIENLYEISWEDGNKLEIRNGELKGYIDMRDGNEGENGSPAYKGVPYYIKKLNQFVRTFAMAFNEGFIDYNNNGVIESGENITGHADGYRFDAKAGDPVSGIRFFTYINNVGKIADSNELIGGAVTESEIAAMYNKITAKNFTVGYEVMTDLNAISTSGAPGENENAEIVDALIELRHNKEVFAEGEPEDFMKSLVSTLGVDAQQAKNFATNQQAVVKQIDNRRLSYSGVSLDEEFANLIKYQHAYNACAQMINTMAEIYDTLINRVGV